MRNLHVVVWLDHQQAYVFRFNSGSTQKLALLSTLRHPRLQDAAGDMHSICVMEDGLFYANIECALNGAGEIVLAGPANEKFELFEHMCMCAKPLSRRVMGIALADDPTAPQLADIAAKYFGAVNEPFELFRHTA